MVAAYKSTDMLADCVVGCTWEVVATNICFCTRQMSKSTGNFLTLTQAIDKFSADGAFAFHQLTPPFSSFPLHSTMRRLFCQYLTCLNETLKEPSGVRLGVLTVSAHSLWTITLDGNMSFFIHWWRWGGGKEGQKEKVYVMEAHFCCYKKKVNFIKNNDFVSCNIKN